MVLLPSRTLTIPRNRKRTPNQTPLICVFIAKVRDRAKVACLNSLDGNENLENLPGIGCIECVVTWNLLLSPFGSYFWHSKFKVEGIWRVWWYRFGWEEAR